MPRWQIAVLIPATIEVEAPTESEACIATERAEPGDFDMNVLELQIEWVEQLPKPNQEPAA